jgi:hypothetical protein
MSDQSVEEQSAWHDDIWAERISPAIEAAMQPLRAPKRDVPGQLLHFTGAQALTRILQEKRVRLSTVRASNDPLEVTHGIGLARRHLESVKIDTEADRIYRAAVEAALEGKLLDGTTKPLPSPHVCCFSTPESEGKVEHWALYGRGGSGFALVFDGPALVERATGLADLVPVIYAEEEQAKLLRDVIDRGRQVAGEAADYAEKYNTGWAIRTFLITAYAFGTLASYFAAATKKGEWAFEKEWRLLAGSTRIQDERETMKFSADAVGPVVRTFFEFPFEPASLKAIIVGPVHGELNVPAVEDLLPAYGYRNVEVRLGQIALRTIAT